MRHALVPIVIALALIGAPLMAAVSPSASCAEKGCCNHAMDEHLADPLSMSHHVCNCAMTPLATCHWEPGEQPQPAVVLVNDRSDDSKRPPLVARLTDASITSPSRIFHTGGPDTGPLPKPPPLYLLTCTLII